MDRIDTYMVTVLVLSDGFRVGLGNLSYRLSFIVINLAKFQIVMFRNP